MSTPGMQNLNDTEPGGLISEPEFEDLLRKSWIVPVEPETKVERMAKVPFAIVLGVLGAVLLIHWLAK